MRCCTGQICCPRDGGDLVRNAYLVVSDDSQLPTDFVETITEDAKLMYMLCYVDGQAGMTRSSVLERLVEVVFLSNKQRCQKDRQ